LATKREPKAANGEGRAGNYKGAGSGTVDSQRKRITRRHIGVLKNLREVRNMRVPHLVSF
jgi:hypothetical protein